MDTIRVELLESLGVLDNVVKDTYQSQKTVDLLIQEQIKTVQDNTVHSYSPRRFEIWLVEAMEILNRCENYKREAESLSSLDFLDKLARHTRRKKREEIKADLQKQNTASNQMMAKLDQASAKAQHENKLGDAFCFEADSLNASYRTDRTSTAGFDSNITTIEENEDDVIEIEQALAGSALNYADRERRVKELLKSDCLEAYEKLQSVRQALNIFGVARNDWFETNKLPGSETPKPLEEMISFARAADRLIDRHSQRDVETFVHYVIEHRLNVDTPPIHNPLNTTFEIGSPQYPLPAGLEHCRVLGVKIGYRAENWLPTAESAQETYGQRNTFATRPHMANYVFNGTVTVPAQPLPEKQFEIPVSLHAVVRNVGNDAEQDWLRSPLIVGRHAKGDWHIQVTPIGAFNELVGVHDSMNWSAIVVTLHLLGSYSDAQ